VYIEAILLNLLVNLVLVDINVFKLSAKLILLLRNYAYSLLVVILNNRRVVKLKDSPLNRQHYFSISNSASNRASSSALVVDFVTMR
jgi:hypothetical protein